MPLWRIEPAAERGDDRWLDHEIWREVIVRAPNAAMARLIAGRLERREAADEVGCGNESLPFRSAFEDEKLYRVSRVSEDELPDIPRAGADEVVKHARESG